ncbi:YugN family protein [Bacillus sp. 1P06AnD]|uniref:YugN family protein n=1 Tax=Bacillus sp. 1P06AnD TaxID=3132208 RepID=UPI0039A31FDD
MRFEDTNLEQYQAEINRLDEVMNEHGLIRAEQWDYERVNYDRKIELSKDIFYLRVQGYAVEGDVGAHRAVIQLMVPILGKHYYPHGLEYGEAEYFPPSLVKKCEDILKAVSTEVRAFAVHI